MLEVDEIRPINEARSKIMVNFHCLIVGMQRRPYNK